MNLFHKINKLIIASANLNKFELIKRKIIQSSIDTSP
jgi:hypothetical protein